MKKLILRLLLLSLGYALQASSQLPDNFKVGTEVSYTENGTLNRTSIMDKNRFLIEEDVCDDDILKSMVGPSFELTENDNKKEIKQGSVIESGLERLQKFFMAIVVYLKK